MEAEHGTDFELLPVAEPGELWAWDLVARGFAIRQRGERTRFYDLLLPDGSDTLGRAETVFHDVDGGTLYLLETPEDKDAREPARKVSLRVRGTLEQTVGRYVVAAHGKREAT